MYSWLEHEILQMQDSDYFTVYAIAVFALGFMLYFAWTAFRRYRFMDGTATSRIRSAAQGQVELKGLGELLPEDTILSPFSNNRCIWYHCTIDKRKRSGKQRSWVNIRDECSEGLFRIVDETGECIVDPDDAHVIAERDITWFGNSTDAQFRPPSSSGWFRIGILKMPLGMGRYRFRERLIRPATSLYALGWFRSLQNSVNDEYVKVQVEDLVRQWKLQPERYLKDFDFDQNGIIQQAEWEAIQVVARKQVLARIAEESRDQHLLSRSADKRLPFILSAVDEETLVARKKWLAHIAIGGAFTIFVILVLMYSIRAPFAV